MGHRDWTSAADRADGERDLQARIEHELPQLLALARRLTREDHDAEGWPAAKVAERLDVGTDAAHKRIQRARTRLISALADPASPALTPPAFACRSARAHAHDLLEGTLEETTRAEIQQHLDTCPSCPAALQAAAGVPSGLHAEHGAVQVPEPPARAARRTRPQSRRSALN